MGYNKGKLNGRYIDNRTRKIYYCKQKGCNNIISYQTWKKGKGRCQSCAVKYLCSTGILNKKGIHSSSFNKKHSTQTKQKMSLSHGGNGVSKKDTIYYCKEKYCNNIIHYTTYYRGKGRCLSCSTKQQHRDKGFNYNRTPNKPEIVLTKLLKNILPTEYKYTGNNAIAIGTFNPDFVNKDNNKIIELFGCYWHKCKECGFGNGRKIDERRIKTYTKSAYKTLIIWEHELKDLDKVTSKILEFNKKRIEMSDLVYSSRLHEEKNLKKKMTSLKLDNQTKGGDLL